MQASEQMVKIRSELLYMRRSSKLLGVSVPAASGELSSADDQQAALLRPYRRFSTLYVVPTWSLVRCAAHLTVSMSHAGLSAGYCTVATRQHANGQRAPGGGNASEHMVGGHMPAAARTWPWAADRCPA